MRLDAYVFENGHAPSRERARALVMAGNVYVNGEKALKPGQAVPVDAQIEVRGKDHAYVSRGGLKLEKALKVFDASPRGRVCMDMGASTGGFTDCMLQNGAAKVYAVDVGYGQLAWALRSNKQVVVMERTNARNLTADDIADEICFFTVDVSFISLSHILPAAARVSGNACEGICLVKPQFEAGKDKVGKNGVVRDSATHKQVLKKAMADAVANGFSVKGLDYSPIKGPKGNIEFLMLVEKAATAEGLPPSAVDDVCQKAHMALDISD